MLRIGNHGFYTSDHTRRCVMRKKIKRILLIIGIFGFLIFIFQGIDLVVAKDPDYPTKPIAFYITFGAGGLTDTVARSLLEATSKHLGQPFIPINKPGGGGTLGAIPVLNAKPDGYTLGQFVGGHIFLLPHLEECPYRDLSGFTFIMNYVKFIFPVIVRTDAPYKTWKEFIEWARQNPRAAKVAFPAAKSQSPQGMSMWQVEKKERIEITYMVLPGTAEALSALLGGHITMEAMSADAATMSYIKEGKFRILAYMSKEKIPGYEDIPSFHELYGIVAPTFMGVWGPKGLPTYVSEKLDDAFAKGVRDPNFVNLANRLYTPIVYMNRAEVNKETSEMFRKVGELLKILRAEEAKEKK